MARTVVGNGGSVFGASGGRWPVGILAVVGTFGLAYAFSAADGSRKDARARDGRLFGDSA